MPESYNPPPRRSPPRYSRLSPRRRSPSPRGHDYPPPHSRGYGGRRPPSPPHHSYSRRDDYYHERDSGYGGYRPDDRYRYRHERDRYDDRRRYSERERESASWQPNSRYRERSPIRDRRRSPPSPRPRRKSRSRSRSRPRIRSRSRTPSRREPDSRSKIERAVTCSVEKSGEPRSSVEPQVGLSKIAPPIRESSRHPELKEHERALKTEASTLCTLPSPTSMKIEQDQSPAQTSMDQKSLTVKIEPLPSPMERVPKLPNAVSNIPTGPRILQAENQTPRSPRPPTGPMADRYSRAAMQHRHDVKQETESPISATVKKDAVVVPRLPLITLWDPIPQQEKTKLYALREERKQEEARSRERQRELAKAIHEYELARLELSAVEKRRALAESQLEQLCRVDV